MLKLTKTININMRSIVLTILLVVCLMLVFTTYTRGKPEVEKSPVFDKRIIRATGGKQENAFVKEEFKPWLENDCKPLKRLIQHKDIVQKRIMQTVSKLSTDFVISSDAKKYQIQAFRILSLELNETEGGILNALNWMKNALKGDLKNFDNLQEKSKARLESLKDSTLKEEQEYKEILEAQLGLEKLNGTGYKGLLGQLMADVAQAADELELSLNENIFNEAIKDKNMAGKIETVVKLTEGDDNAPVVKKDIETNNNNTEPDVNDDDSIVKLVDSKDNQFVLAKGSDSTVPHEDHHFIQDVIYLMFISVVFGYICHLLTLPTMFGYIIAGVILGPSGFNFLQSLVQLETLGEFGVFFILFTVGLEFSPTEVKKVLKIATLGTFLMVALFIMCGVLIGMLLNATIQESVFVAACLSLSSTPLVIKFLSPNTAVPKPTSSVHDPSITAVPISTTDYGSVLLGILIMQDVFLGLLMAVLPNLAGVDSEPNAKSYLMVALRMSAALIAAVLMTVLMSKYIVGRFYDYLNKLGSREILVLFTISLTFTVLSITNILDISMELGCFLAGVMISAQGHQVADQIEQLIQPVKDFLACIFFASIGLHVFPQFLAYQLTFLTTLTLAVVGAKYLISLGVLALLTRSSHSVTSTEHIKWLVSAGLSQVSEFSFVLSSRARRLGLISREVYLLILSITTLSLLFAPVLWKSTLWRLRIKPKIPNMASIASQVLVQTTDETNQLLSSDEEDAIMSRRISLLPQ